MSADDDATQDPAVTFVVEAGLAWEPADPDTVPVVLITTGSFAPIHRMHVATLLGAVTSVNAHGVAGQPHAHVLAGLISPSHDAYVGGKLGSASIPGSERTAMITAAVADAAVQDTLTVDTWELCQPDFVDYPAVVAALRDRLVPALHAAGADSLAERLVVAYVAGADHVARCPVHVLARKGLKVVCVPRPGQTDRVLRKYPTSADAEWLSLADTEIVQAAAAALDAPLDASSTAVRTALLQHDKRALDALVFPSTAAALGSP